jgi:hypothetical protein
VLETKEKAYLRQQSFDDFHELFVSEEGWTKFAKMHANCGGDRHKLERLAVRWLCAEQSGEALFEECKLVPGFAEHLGISNYSRTGDVHELVGYQQLRKRFQQEGGDPTAMDEMMQAQQDAMENPHDSRAHARYQELRRQFEAKYCKRRGCLSGLFIFLAIIATFALTGFMALP